MSTRDFFKNSVLEAFGQVDPAKIGLSLLFRGTSPRQLPAR